jgi:hypothetical protein
MRECVQLLALHVYMYTNQPATLQAAHTNTAPILVYIAGKKKARLSTPASTTSADTTDTKIASVRANAYDSSDDVNDINDADRNTVMTVHRSRPSRAAKTKLSPG